MVQHSVRGPMATRASAPGLQGPMGAGLSPDDAASMVGPLCAILYSRDWLRTPMTPACVLTATQLGAGRSRVTAPTFCPPAFGK